MGLFRTGLLIEISGVVRVCTTQEAGDENTAGL
jgi:hypothetical protein